MKSALLLTLVLQLTCSFRAPVPAMTRAPSSIFSDAAVEEPAAAAPVETGPVPCFGATPWLGGTYFVGEKYWNKVR